MLIIIITTHSLNRQLLTFVSPRLQMFKKACKQMQNSNRSIITAAALCLVASNTDWKDHGILFFWLRGMQLSSVSCCTDVKPIFMLDWYG